MKKYIYNGFDHVSKTFKDGFMPKDPVVWADNSPGNDYTEEVSASFLPRELKQKRKRKTYGRQLHELVASQMRLERIENDPSLAAHQAARYTTYENLSKLQSNIENGNFISAYEDVNTLKTAMEFTATQIIQYRFIVAQYLTSTSQYTDGFGNSVEGGQYDELKGLTLDAQGFIIET